MSLELLGAIDASTDSGAPTIKAYTDGDTVTKVQQFLRGIGGGKAFPIKIDGQLGPETNAAVKKFNTDFRNTPMDREFITEGTLASMGIETSATPAEVYLKPALPSSGRPAKGWSQMQPGAMGPAVTPSTALVPAGETPSEGFTVLGRPWYVVAGIGLGAALLGTGVVVAVTR